MLPKRKSLRLPNHDYACGWYFVTICTKDKRYRLGTVVGGDAHIAPHVELSNIGSVAEMYLKRIPGIDTYVVMPNHVHFIVSIATEGRCGHRPLRKHWDAWCVLSKPFQRKLPGKNSGSEATTTISFGVRRIISAFGNIWMKTPSGGRRTSIILNKYRRKPYV